MQQKDYLLREVDKIGAMLAMVRERLFGSAGSDDLSIGEAEVTAGALLLGEVGFDLPHFMALEDEAALAYISGIAGFSIENLEVFAALLAKMGYADSDNNGIRYLKRTLVLYQQCAEIVRLLVWNERRR